MTIMQSASRIFSSLLLIVVMACVANMEGRQDRITVVVSSASWYVHAVDVVCDDNRALLHTERGITMGVRLYRFRVSTNTCSRVSFRLRRLAKPDYFLRDQATMIQTGDTVCLEIQNAVNLSYAYNCTRRTDGGYAVD